MSYKLKSLRVLVIDDNAPIRLLVRSLLLDLGFGHVHAEADAQQGWECYIKDRPDIILVDWRMDKQDGIEFTRRVRQEKSSHNPTVPIIIMTGFTNKKRVFDARDSGVTEFLIKPFTVQTLSDRLTHIIEKPRDFVLANQYVGPDRRRRKDEVAPTEKKRKADKLAEKAAEKAAEKTPVTAGPQKSKKYIDLRGGTDNKTNK